MSPLVSVVMPVFNREKWLPISVGSVQRQTFGDWELLLVDDRSTDGTAALARDLQSEDARIRYGLNPRTKGPSGARNHGLDEARGKYIAYLDSDDEWEPFHLERMVYFLEKYPDRIDVMNANPLRKYRDTGVVYGKRELDLVNLSYERLEDAYLLEKESAISEQLRRRVLVTQAIVGKADVFKRVRWQEHIVAGEDSLYCFEVLYTGAKVCHLQQFHCIYWAHGDNTVNCLGTHSPQRMLRIHQGFVLFWQEVLAKPKLSAVQRAIAETQLAHVLAWHLGYHCYEPLGELSEARRCYLRAAMLKPTELGFWRAYAATWPKQWLGLRSSQPPIDKESSSDAAPPQVCS